MQPTRNKVPEKDRCRSLENVPISSPRGRPLRIKARHPDASFGSLTLTRPAAVSLHRGIRREAEQLLSYICEASPWPKDTMLSPIDVLDNLTAKMVKTWVLHALGAGLSLVASPSLAQGRTWEDYKAHNRTPSSCPDYTDYSQERHDPLSTGSLALPYMRPSPECRIFNSSAVEVRPCR